ncbi:ThiF family adenylyltransferase [Nocardia terpenica]|uniref:Thiamine biosynthesis protein ThiF n=1 Tax=Nocardia terpenica TaxID=455432 RepID=A0A6G9Z015_9NOCA|nr:ThiF family adenylyltransferase [Nocardia terpenica]QIS18939.1 thiamine biosynthesis protein ThiF [Nocardia terpenica]
MRIEILHPVRHADRIGALTHPGSGYRFVDAWDMARAEILAVNSGELPSPSTEARFVVYPWRKTIVRLPNSELYRRLRSSRNRFIIEDDEQSRWAEAVLGVAGLSVGASALTSCSLTGARRFRLAEYDTLSITNLNRLAASVCDIGTPKLALAQRRVLELDPYSSIDAFPEGCSRDSTAAFLGTASGCDQLAVLIEEMDDIAAKVELRKQARAAGIPVVMATDNGDNAILDVERFDLDRQYPLFHGRAGGVEAWPAKDLRNPRHRVALAQRIVGIELTARTRFSLTQVGRTLTGWPQLGTAAAVAGAAAAYAARLIVTGHPLQSGRYRVDLDDTLLGHQAE